ncbi:glucosaminidase domain-containing protein [Duganella sp. HH101]|uniref:glucosaminidase domain-containing protein n=1 Tax=Duganella sp. HH101 TaxID=1781066 RepID=UPI0008FC9957|nr:glucosaminidase domain-containing protein [Duganella sp. HH101]
MSRHAHALAQIHAHKHAHKAKPRQQPAHVARFIGLHVSDAQIIAARTGIPAEVILAQSALESNWGRSVKGSYATDPYYAQKLKSIIHLHITPLLKK